MSEERNGWDTWKEKVLSDTSDMKTAQNDLRKDFQKFQLEVLTELGVIKTKMELRASVVGAIAGLLSSIGVSLIVFFLTQ